MGVSVLTEQDGRVFRRSASAPAPDAPLSLSTRPYNLYKLFLIHYSLFIFFQGNGVKVTGSTRNGKPFLRGQVRIPDYRFIPGGMIITNRPYATLWGKGDSSHEKHTL